MPRHPRFIEKQKQKARERAKQKRSWESQKSLEELHGKFYRSKAWRALRDTKIWNDPVCEYHDHFYPKDKGIVIPATEVDHILSLSERPDLALDYDNLKSTCKSCHRKKTLQDYRLAKYKKETGRIEVGAERQDALNDFGKSLKDEKINIKSSK